MKRKQKHPNIPYILWETEEGEELNSMDFFEDVEKSVVRSMVLYDDHDKNTLSIYGLEANSFISCSSFPVGMIFVAKEERL